MVTIYLLGRLLYRERSPLNTIGFAALCLLAASPHSLLDSSFQMTLLAVVSIAGIAAPLLAQTVHPYLKATRDLRTVSLDVKLEPRIAQFRVVLRMIAHRLQRVASARVGWKVFPWSVRFGLRCVELLVVSCVVELAMTLPMAIYFHRITIFALPVNVFILPLLAVLMPAALLTLVASIVWPAAAVVPAMAAALFLHLGVGLVSVFGSFRFGDFRIPAPLLWQSGAFCVLLALAMVLARGSRWQRHAAWAALALTALAAVSPRPIDHPRDALLVEAIDVGQGDSILLITPDGKTLLVDGGGFGGGPWQAPQDFDIGEEVVSPALWARGIRHLDVVALSHAHSDHMGGLPAVLRNFHPSELWVGKNPRVAPYIALLDEAKQLGVTVKALHADDAFGLGETSVQVLAPFRDYVPGPEPTNNDSLVLHVAYGGSSVLLEGDAEAPIEQAMLTENGLQSTLLKVGHHGSVTSTRPEFLARAAPQWAVISCGLHNRYGHPRANPVARFDTRAACPSRPSSDCNRPEYAPRPSTTGLALLRPRHALRTCISSFEDWAKKLSGWRTVETPGSLRSKPSMVANQKSLRGKGPPADRLQVISWFSGVYAIGVKTGMVVAVAGAVSFTHCVKGFCAPNMFWRSKSDSRPCNRLPPAPSPHRGLLARCGRRREFHCLKPREPREGQLHRTRVRRERRLARVPHSRVRCQRQESCQLHRRESEPARVPAVGCLLLLRPRKRRVPKTSSASRGLQVAGPATVPPESAHYPIRQLFRSPDRAKMT
jgi:beta-lactamase superfamily II metal-dependent hydrolase